MQYNRQSQILALLCPPLSFLFSCYVHDEAKTAEALLARARADCYESGNTKQLISNKIWENMARRRCEINNMYFVDIYKSTATSAHYNVGFEIRVGGFKSVK
jgi:hypothetical protein